MADETKTTVVLTPEQSAARQLAEELKQQKAQGIQHNKTVPGGHFIGTDGQPHDSEGRPVKSGKQSKMDPEDAAARLAELDDERAELQAAMRRSQAMAEAEGSAPAAEPKSKAKRAGKGK